MSGAQRYAWQGGSAHIRNLPPLPLAPQGASSWQVLQTQVGTATQSALQKEDLALRTWLITKDPGHGRWGHRMNEEEGKSESILQSAERDTDKVVQPFCPV